MNAIAQTTTEQSITAKRMSGKRIVVTAAASGMGRAGAELFAQHGAQVCVVDYNADSAQETVQHIRESGGTAHAIVANLLSKDDSKNIVHDAAEFMGGIDALWLHAGMPSPHGIEELDEAAVSRCFDLNINSVIASVGAAIPYLRQARSPSIVMTSSISGLVGSRHSPIYSVTKFGIVGLVKSLALTHGKDQIRVNALCPGITETPMMHDFMSDEARAKYVEAIPLGRIAKPLEIAMAALWLLSDDSSYVSGVALPVDGGFTAG
jgi:NAD(P)-dependent dehydrogenase (short-subunit alcohol dehydrogenase family)